MRRFEIARGKTVPPGLYNPMADLGQSEEDTEDEAFSITYYPGQ